MGYGRNPELREEIHAVRRTCKLHTESSGGHDWTWVAGAVRQHHYQLHHCATVTTLRFIDRFSMKPNHTTALTTHYTNSTFILFFSILLPCTQIPPLICTSEAIYSSHLIHKPTWSFGCGRKLEHPEKIHGSQGELHTGCTCKLQHLNLIILINQFDVFKLRQWVQKHFNTGWMSWNWFAFQFLIIFSILKWNLNTAITAIHVACSLLSADPTYPGNYNKSSNGRT